MKQLLEQILKEVNITRAEIVGVDVIKGPELEFTIIFSKSNASRVIGQVEYGGQKYLWKDIWR